MTSSFFARDPFLKRQPRTLKQRPDANVYTSSSSLMSGPLHIIHEEDEPRTSSSSSRSSSPSYAPSVSPGRSQASGLKARRRHVNVTVSDIRVAKATLHNDNDISEQHFTLLSAPRPAPLPPPSTPSANRSPVLSPDSFHLTFTDKSFSFPHPPIPISLSGGSPDSRLGSESPTPSMSTSDASTSPDCQSTCLPTTPSSSDDEFPSYYASAWPSFNARRVSIKPLVINKFNQPTVVENSDLPIPLDQPSRDHEAHQSQTAFSSRSDGHLSDDESDSEWYTREFSKILTLRSPLLPSSPQKSRPESMALPNRTAPEPTKGPPLGFPSTQLDPAFPRRHSNMPRYPPPVAPLHLRSHSATPFVQTLPKPKSKPRSAALSLRRPPPRSSVPADCVFIDSDASYYAFSDDSASTFSVSMYDTLPTPTSAKSTYSQPSPFPESFPSTPSSFPESASSQEFDLNGASIQFAIADTDNRVMMLPSLPGSPIDLEADIASGLEELRLRLPSQEDDVFIASPSTNTAAAGPAKSHRILQSKWSSSTLNSIREEHAWRSASAKLRAHFNTGIHSPSPKSRTSISSKKLTTPSTPTFSSRHPRREMYTYTHTKNDLFAYFTTEPPDVGVMGYEQAETRPQELKRRESVSPSASDAGAQ